MWIVIVVANLAIAAFNFYLAWRVWRLRRALAAATRGLLSAEASTHSVLYPAPGYIIIGQRGTRQLRDRYAQLDVQLARLRRLVAILLLLPKLWRRTRRRR